ncbi:phage portal protein [Primorskyibacter sp. S187A]|uniref:phage portal protein n=1 Tax=Primorskyibacter sp. S187A TaxID=3415130 RepID=UPI003C7ACB12
MFDFLRGRKGDGHVPETKASATGPLVAYTSGGRAAWSPRDAVSLTKTGFANNPVGFRAVKLIAEAAAAIPLVLQDDTERFDVHPLLSILSRPNPAQRQAELLEALFGQLILTGNGYVEAVGAGGTAPVELHVLRSDRMAVVPGRDGWPVAYDYTVSGRKHRFDASGEISPICHIKSFHPQDDHYGLSPLQAAAQAIDVHNSASRWSKALLDNAARPSGAIVYKGSDGASMTPEQYDRLSSEIETNHQGARNAGRPMLLEGGLDWKPMGFSPSDMEFHKTKEAAAREIALAFGVPPMLLGIPGDATYANYAEANRAFYRLTVLPLAARVSAALGGWLGAFSGDRVALKPDLDQVPALASEREAQWSRVANAAFLSTAEKRRMLGLPAEVSDE